MRITETQNELLITSIDSTKVTGVLFTAVGVFMLIFGSILIHPLVGAPSGIIIIAAGAYLSKSKSGKQRTVLSKTGMSSVTIMGKTTQFQLSDIQSIKTSEHVGSTLVAEVTFDNPLDTNDSTSISIQLKNGQSFVIWNTNAVESDMFNKSISSRLSPKQTADQIARFIGLESASYPGVPEAATQTPAAAAPQPNNELRIDVVDALTVGNINDVSVTGNIMSGTLNPPLNVIVGNSSAQITEVQMMSGSLVTFTLQTTLPPESLKGQTITAQRI